MNIPWLIVFAVFFVLMILVKAVLALFLVPTVDGNSGNPSNHDGEDDGDDIPKGKVRSSCPGKKYSWAWMQTAGAVDLSFVRPEKNNGYPAIRGCVRGMKVAVSCRPLGNGSSTTVCRIYFKRPFALGLSICTDKRGVESDSMVSLRSVLDTVQEPELFACIGNAELFREYLTPECRAFLSAGYKAYPFVRITDSCFEVRYPEIFDDPDQFLDQLSAVFNAAGFFSAMSEKMAKPKLQVKTAVRNAAPVQVNIPSEPEPPAEEPNPAVQPEEETRSAEPPAEEKISPLDKETLLPELWPSSFPGERERQLFEQFKGQTVEWEGTLKTAYDYASDFVFGSGGGVKASFELMEFKPAGSALSIAVKAVVSLPREASAVLRNSSGKTFRFRGKLLKFEPVAREIYLSGGELLNN